MLLKPPVEPKRQGEFDVANILFTDCQQKKKHKFYKKMRVKKVCPMSILETEDGLQCGYRHQNRSTKTFQKLFVIFK